MARTSAPPRIRRGTEMRRSRHQAIRARGAHWAHNAHPVFVLRLETLPTEMGVAVRTASIGQSASADDDAPVWALRTGEPRTPEHPQAGGAGATLSPALRPHPRASSLDAGDALSFLLSGPRVVNPAVQPSRWPLTASAPSPPVIESSSGPSDLRCRSGLSAASSVNTHSPHSYDGLGISSESVGSAVAEAKGESTAAPSPHTAINAYPSALGLISTAYRRNRRFLSDFGHRRQAMSVVEAHVQCLIEIQDVVNTQILMSVDLFNYVAREPLAGALEKRPSVNGVSRADETRWDNNVFHAFPPIASRLPGSSAGLSRGQYCLQPGRGPYWQLEHGSSISQDPLCAIVTSRVCGCSGVLSSPALGEIFTAFRHSASVPQQHRRTCLDRSNPRDEGPLGQSTTKSLPRAHGKTIVSNKDCAAEEVEASTRVAILVKDNTPVLLHCSSGVRRTGGALSEAPTDAIDLDPPAPSNFPATKDDTQPTVPVSVCDCEVDSMDVNARSPPAPVSSESHTLPNLPDAVRPPTLEASPELVEEVRRAAMGVLPAALRADVAPFCPSRTSRTCSSGGNSGCSAGRSSGNTRTSRPAAKLASDELVRAPSSEGRGGCSRPSSTPPVPSASDTASSSSTPPQAEAPLSSDLSFAAQPQRVHSWWSEVHSSKEGHSHLQCSPLPRALPAPLPSFSADANNP
ncbi:uncharacterized protein BXZ73DRAFT_82091 [Epithele typhae]|uniref:uncharacterized protein n=1 Tax=Epithele typhae TaxID=378194 RepID=UPI002008D4D5|nr:uncharacterized protein BXZ73DRAFT_82091 [Epithele typhae]KAH9912916.1 hypothetical protein BXZ73DRAFT_82091 [Epithele typhae]